MLIIGRYANDYFDFNGFVDYVVDFTLRHIAERIPNGVYFTMISDTCMSGGILDSANELYGGQL